MARCSIITGAPRVGRLVGPDLKRLLSDIVKLTAVTAFTDGDVEAQNRVTLSTSLPPDQHGPVPRVEVHHRSRSARTSTNREFLVGQAVRLLQAAGAIAIYTVHWPPALSRSIPRFRWGVRADHSVLDENAEAR